MSTAILHAGNFIHDFNDNIVKNQSNSAKINGAPNNQSNKDKFQSNEETNFAKQTNDGLMASVFATGQQKKGLQIENHHVVLTRAVSTPVSEANQVAMNIFTSLNDILNCTGSTHRKLERTQSEPIPQSASHTSRYKTELCRPFEEAGECKYGDKCQFAHGFHELRNLQRHPKYKTELCRTFHSVGFCPYGARCHFIHSSQEALIHNKNVAAYQARLLQARTKSSSISIGSDRETSSVGSISPTMIHSQNQTNCFGDHSSPTTIFSYSFSPSNSPISKPLTPPPTTTKLSTGVFVKPDQNIQHNKVMKHISEDARLPVFNQISSAIDLMNTFKI